MGFLSKPHLTLGIDMLRKAFPCSTTQCPAKTNKQTNISVHILGHKFYHWGLGKQVFREGGCGGVY